MDRFSCWPRGLTTAMCGASVLIASGCAGPGFVVRDTRMPADGQITQDGDIRFVNPFTPTDLRVHPLTRLQLEPPDGGPRIDVHLEFFDRYGDPVKALGDLEFVLYRGRRVGDATEQVARWRISIMLPGDNAAAFDRVTRTYRVTLTGLPAALDDSSGLLLVATFARPDGRRLSATHAF